MGWKTATVVVLLILGSFVYVHEMSHFALAERYGCNATINWVPDTTSNELAKWSVSSVSMSCPEETREINEVAQNQVEATGYQLFPLYTMFALLGVVVFW